MMPYSWEEFPFHQMPDDAPTPADQNLAVRVAARLGQELSTPDDHFVVSVQNGVVILEGILTQKSLVDRLHRTTWQVVGVVDVCNLLSAWDCEPDARQ
ncbi:MAG TPA: BON domain-containing protein [Mycobacterium sp.]|nr:BON domain-containing protein [Mycobacterium sp.]